MEQLTSHCGLCPPPSPYTDKAQVHPHRRRSPPDSDDHPLLLPDDVHDDSGFYGGGWMQQGFDHVVTPPPAPAPLAQGVVDASLVRVPHGGESVVLGLELPATLTEAGSSSRPRPQPPPRPRTQLKSQTQMQRAQLFDALRRGELSSSSGSQLSNDDGPAVVSERGAPRADTTRADAAARLYVLTHRRSAPGTATFTGSHALVPPSQADASRNPGTFDLALHLLQDMRDRQPGHDEMRALVDTVGAAVAAQAAERELAGGGPTTQACVCSHPMPNT